MVQQSTRLQGHMTNVVSGLTNIVTTSRRVSERQLNTSCEGQPIESTSADPSSVLSAVFVALTAQVSEHEDPHLDQRLLKEQRKAKPGPNKKNGLGSQRAGSDAFRV